MAHVMVKTDLVVTDEAQEFCRFLGVDDSGCWYLVALWSWGIMHDRDDGRIPALIAEDRQRIASIVGYRGDPDLLWAGLTKPMGRDGKPWLQPLPDGSYRMRGWSIQDRFFREKRRLRNLHNKNRKDQDGNLRLLRE